MIRRSIPCLLRIPSFSQVAKYELVGSPLRIGGSNDRLSFEVVSTTTNALTKEPMRIYALSGYVSCLYICQYPERPGANAFMMDCGTRIDATRVEFFLKNAKGVAGSQHTVEPAAASRGDGQPAATIGHSDATLESVLKLAVATHAHPDHCGAAAAYRERRIRVAGPKHIERYYQGLRGQAQMLAERILLTAFAYMLGRTRMERPWVCRAPPLSGEIPRLEDGMSLPLGFDDWQVVACHGHTGHMVGLFHPATGIFYAADLIIARGKRFTGPMPVDMPAEYIRTVRRLRTLPVRWLLLAHGGVIDLSDVAGGWDYVLDEVEAHVTSGTMSPALRLVSPISCLGLEPKLYDPQRERPTRVVRVDVVDPVPVLHLK